MLEATARKIDEAAASYAEQLSDPHLNRLKRAMTMANAMKNLELALTADVMNRVKWLMNKPFGFMTDRGPHNPKAPEPYSDYVVKQCVLHGLLRGFFPVDNEMNIIAGKFYPAKAGWERKLREIPGVSDINPRAGVPRTEGGRQVVRIGFSWKINGAKFLLTNEEGQPYRDYAINAYANSTADNIIGKALAKATRDAYLLSTGSTLSNLDDPDFADVAPGGEATGGLPGRGRSKVGGREPLPEDHALAEVRRELVEAFGRRIEAADTAEAIGAISKERNQESRLTDADHSELVRQTQNRLHALNEEAASGGDTQGDAYES